jgi:hypothetical protein
MRQSVWDEFEVRHCSETLRARDRRHPLTTIEKDRIVRHVLQRLSAWCELFPDAGLTDRPEPPGAVGRAEK